RRGLATDNLRWAIERCAARKLIAGLDATPAGREVYRPLGFVDGWGLHRLRAESPKLAEPRLDLVLRPMRADDLAEISAMDAAAFGAARTSLLAHLFERLPPCAWVARDQTGGLAGFLLGRDGRLTWHLGPLMARDTEVATALLARGLTGLPAAGAEAVTIDVADGQPGFSSRLVDAGFTPLRPFTRMLSRQIAALPASTYAIAGPELG
ncbi:MAG: hypothetical protein AAF637_18335, partial [Pseudomonadota bacterium]